MGGGDRACGGGFFSQGGATKWRRGFAWGPLAVVGFFLNTVAKTESRAGGATKWRRGSSYFYKGWSHYYVS